MQARVRFYGHYRHLIQVPEVRLEIADEATPFELVRRLGEQCGEKLRVALLAEKEGHVCLQAGIRIAVGADVIDFSSDLHRPLASCTATREAPIQVFIFPPLMGGT